MKKKATTKKTAKPTYEELEKENRRWRRAAKDVIWNLGGPSTPMSNRELREETVGLSAMTASEIEQITSVLQMAFCLSDDEMLAVSVLGLAIKAGVIIEHEVKDKEKLKHFATTSATQAVVDAINAARQPKETRDVN